MDSMNENAVYRPKAPAGSVTSGTVLRRLGLSRPRLRYLVAKGYLAPVPVGDGAKLWHAFPPEEVEFLQELLRAQDAGYTLKAAAALARRRAEPRQEGSVEVEKSETPPDDSWLNG
ncbi:MAG: hypothetical protein M5U26_19745 [Planctomycetota bacterium]|nr:hypothetical protein [Planctomycetota bacterium]